MTLRVAAYARVSTQRQIHTQTIDQQLERLTEAYLTGVIPLAEYQRRRRDLEARRLGFDHQEERLAGQAEVAGMVSSVEAFCQRVQAGLATATFEQRR